VLGARAERAHRAAQGGPRIGRAPVVELERLDGRVDRRGVEAALAHRADL
jgi:hypothetical protein